LRIGIVHARWNDTLISALLDGTKKTLKAAGVREENIVVQSVPGSWELPAAVKGYVYTPLLLPPSGRTYEMEEWTRLRQP